MGFGVSVQLPFSFLDTQLGWGWAVSSLFGGLTSGGMKWWPHMEPCLASLASVFCLPVGSRQPSISRRGGKQLHKQNRRKFDVE